MQKKVIIRYRGLQDYTQCWQQMQNFNASRDKNTADEIWLLEHPAVFTLGLNGKAEHILDLHNIPLVNTDRGGQVTYHAPGQLIVYLLFDLRRSKQGVRQLVTQMEQAVIKLLLQFNIVAVAKKDAPGVYVNEEKIAALGLRVKQGGSYHGLSLNIDMELKPFNYINPCGYKGLKVTSLKRLGVMYNKEKIKEQLLTCLFEQFNIDTSQIEFIHESKT